MSSLVEGKPGGGSSAIGRWLVRLLVTAVIVVAVLNQFLKLPVLFPETANICIVVLSSLLFFVPLALIVALVAGFFSWLRAKRRFVRQDDQSPEIDWVSAPRLLIHLYRRLAVIFGILWVLAGVAGVSIGALAFKRFFLPALAVFFSAEFFYYILKKWGPGRGAKRSIRVLILSAVASMLPFVVFALATGLFRGRLFLIVALVLAIPMVAAGLGPFSTGMGLPKGRFNSTAWRSLMLIVLFFNIVSVIGFMNHKIEYLPVCDRVADNPCLVRLSDIGKPYDLLLGPDGRYLYATTGILRQVIRIDLDDPSDVQYLDTGEDSRPERMVMDPGRGEIYIENSHETSLVHVITVDVETFKVNRPRCIADNEKRTSVWIDLDPNRDNLIVTYERINGAAVSTYNLETMRENNRKNLSWKMKDPYGGVMDAKGDRFYVDAWIFGRLLIQFNPDTLYVQNSLYLGPMSFGMTVDQSSGKVYVARFINAAIDVIDGRRLKKIATFPAGFGVRDIAVDQGRNLIYTSNFCDGSFDVIEAGDGELLHRLKIGIASRDVHFDPEYDRVFVASECGIFEVKIGELLKERDATP